MSEDSLIVNILTGKNTLLPELNKVMNAGKMLGAMKVKGFDIAPQIEEFNKHVAKSSPLMMALNDGMKEGAKRAHELKTRFDMNILSWVFGGMALQRMGLTMMRFLIPNVEKLALINDAASKKVMGVYAAFEFLKISIFETLMGIPGVQNFIADLVGWLISLSEWAQTHPEAVENIAKIAAAAAVLGTIAIGVGIFGQLEHLITLLGDVGKEAGGAVSSLDKIGGTAAKIYLTYELISELLTGDSLSKKIFSAALLALALSPIPGGALIAFGISILVDLLVPDSWWTSLDTWLADTYKYIKTGISKEQEKQGELSQYTPMPDPWWKRPTTVMGAKGTGTIIGSTIGAILGGMTGGPFGAGLLGISGGMIGYGLGGLYDILFKTNDELVTLKEKADEADYALTGGSLVPSLWLLYDSLIANITQLPLMINQLVLAKTAIDAIPDATHKYVYIHTIHDGGGGGGDSVKETVGSVTGGTGKSFSIMKDVTLKSTRVRA